MEEYDNEKWRIISGKVGNGFSASACKEKSTELDTEEDGTPLTQSEPPETTTPTTPQDAPKPGRRETTEVYDIARSTEGS